MLPRRLVPCLLSFLRMLVCQKEILRMKWLLARIKVISLLEGIHSCDVQSYAILSAMMLHQRLHVNQI